MVRSSHALSTVTSEHLGGGPGGVQHGDRERQIAPEVPQGPGNGGVAVGLILSTGTSCPAAKLRLFELEERQRAAKLALRDARTGRQRRPIDLGTLCLASGLHLVRESWTSRLGSVAAGRLGGTGERSSWSWIRTVKFSAVATSCTSCGLSASGVAAVPLADFSSSRSTRPGGADDSQPVAAPVAPAPGSYDWGNGNLPARSAARGCCTHHRTPSELRHGSRRRA